MSKATYRDIQQRVKVTHGFVPKTCWIADVKSANGMTMRAAANRLSADRRLHPCPSGKRAPIESALRYFELIK